VTFAYRGVQSEQSERTVRPLCLAYFGPVWMLSAWCELRDDFRAFRLDRVDAFRVTAERFRQEPGKTLHDFLKRDQTWTRSRTTLMAGASPTTRVRLRRMARACETTPAKSVRRALAAGYQAGLVLNNTARRRRLQASSAAPGNRGRRPHGS